MLKLKDMKKMRKIFTLLAGMLLLSSISFAAINITTQPRSVSVCDGSSASFTVVATGATSYIWLVKTEGEIAWSTCSNAIYSGVYTATLNITPVTHALDGNKYECVLSNGVNSVTSTAATLTVIPLPIALISPQVSIVICKNDSVQLETFGTSGNSYEWYLDGFPVGVRQTYWAKDSGDYEVLVTNNGCTNPSNYVTATVRPHPKVQITSVAVCHGYSGTISATGTCCAPPYSYLWRTGATTSSITVTPTSTTVYSVTVTDGNNCQTNTNATVTVHPTPIVLATSMIVCQGDSGTITVTGTCCAAPYSYLWQTGATTSSITVGPDSTTVYSITVTDKYNCQVDTNATVTVNPKPKVQITSVVVCQGTLGTITATGTGSTPPYSYLWQTGATTNSITVNPDTTTVYSITVTDGKNCQTDTNGTVTVNPKPTVQITSAVVCQGEFRHYYGYRQRQHRTLQLFLADRSDYKLYHSHSYFNDCLFNYSYRWK